MNKLAVTTFVLATSLTGTAIAGKGAYTGPIAIDPIGTINPNPTPTTTTPDKLDPTPQPADDPKLLDAFLHSELGKKFVDSVKHDEPILDEIDPGARCKDIQGNYTFNYPITSTTIAGEGVKLGVGAGFKLFADTTKMGAEASFGPTLEVFGQSTKPVEAKLVASTNNLGQHSVDVNLLAFGYTLDTYNVTASTSPIDYLNFIGWSLPDTISGQLGGSYDCSAGVLDNCSVGWSATPLVATLYGGISFRLSPEGLRANSLLVSHVNSDVSLTGNASYSFTNPLTGEKQTVSLSATGTGAIRYFNGSFFGSAKLIPLSNYWLAEAEATVDVPEALGAQVTASFDPPVIDPLTYDVYSHPATSFADQWLYSCTFEKAWK